MPRWSACLVRIRNCPLKLNMIWYSSTMIWPLKSSSKNGMIYNSAMNKIKSCLKITSLCMKLHKPVFPFMTIKPFSILNKKSEFQNYHMTFISESMSISIAYLAKINVQWHNQTSSISKPNKKKWISPSKSSLILKEPTIFTFKPLQLKLLSNSLIKKSNSN